MPKLLSTCAWMAHCTEMLANQASFGSLLVELCQHSLGIGLDLVFATIATEIERPVLRSHLQWFPHRAKVFAADGTDALFDGHGLLRLGKLLDLGELAI